MNDVVVVYDEDLHAQSPCWHASVIASNIAPDLRERFAVLVRGVRVGHHAGAGLQVRDVVLDHDRADVDAGVEVAGVAQIADRAAVEAALHRLQLVDDLHRPDLRRAGERARGEHRAQRVHRAGLGPQRAAHGRDDVHHVRVGLDAHQLADLDRPELAHAPEVVAAQVDEHHVLGALLLVAQQLVRDAQVLLGARRPRAGPGDRPHLGAAARHLHQRLRGRARDREVVPLEEVHVRRRVHDPQAAVDGEGLDRTRPGPAL